MPQSWTCPFCNRPTTLNDEDANNGEKHLFSDTKHEMVGIAWSSARCPNPDCREVSLVVNFTKCEQGYLEIVHLEAIESWTLRPESNAKPLPDYIPQAIQEDYYEACLIVEKSPKASATLSRRCLQGMIRDFWGIRKNRLFDEINALEKKVDNDTWESIKAVKDVGNIGAHMEEDINHIVPVDPQEAQLLIELIEQLLNDWYVQKHEREQRSRSIIEMAEEKKKLKNQAPESASSETDSQ